MGFTKMGLDKTNEMNAVHVRFVSRPIDVTPYTSAEQDFILIFAFLLMFFFFFYKFCTSASLICQSYVKS